MDPIIGSLLLSIFSSAFSAAATPQAKYNPEYKEPKKVSFQDPTKNKAGFAPSMLSPVTSGGPTPQDPLVRSQALNTFKQKMQGV